MTEADMTAVEIILNVILSFVATAGFCIVFNIPKRQILVCGMLGIVSWIVYLLLKAPLGPVVATFFGTCSIVLLARIFAVVRKCPVTILLIPGMIPLAPGSAIYYTAYYFVTNNMEKAAEYGFLTLKLAFAIVLGIIAVIAVPTHHLKKLLNKRSQRRGENSL